MLAKGLPYPRWLLATETLDRRIVQGHYIHPKIKKDLAKRQAGFKGEQILSILVKELPHEQYYIFHDLQLQSEGVYFQIDTLLLSMNLILIIEAKNITGTLTFDSVFKQLIRSNSDGTADVFDDPRVQAECHKLLFQRWLLRQGINFIPIEYIIFFPSSKTNLNAQPGDHSDFSRICRGRSLFIKINDFEIAFNTRKMDTINLEEIKNLLLSSHTQQPVNILNEYKLTSKNIRTGACCPNCLFIPMIYTKGRFSCPSCKTITENAIPDTLNDYSILFKPTITNKEFRQFLHISSADAAQKKLHSLNLPCEGTRKNRIYFIQEKR